MVARHGTHDRYSNYACRCDDCIEANRRYMREYRARLRAGPTPRHVHGSHNGYTNYGCRCGLCTAAHRRTQVKWRQAATGKRRQSA